jgi:pimeloyl-ACP methyl ester carboxylesterase
MASGHLQEVSVDFRCEDQLMDTIEIEGLHIAYERAGTGPPLVLLHGYVGDGPTTWRPQVEELCDEFTVVVWDAPGAGGSSDPPESFGIAGYADCLARFVDKLHLGRPHVAGLSFGGILALKFCHRHPNIPMTLVLVSTYSGWRGSLAPEVAEQRLQQALTLADLSPDKFVETLLPTMFSKNTPRESVDRFRTSLLKFHPAGFRAMARASAEDLRKVLTHINIPTLLICGDADVRAPLGVAEELSKSIPESTLLVLPDAGHICNIEAPEEFNSAVRSFLRGRRS